MSATERPIRSWARLAGQLAPRLEPPLDVAISVADDRSRDLLVAAVSASAEPAGLAAR